MTEVVEQAVDENEVRNREVQNFRPPTVRVGRFVKWFREADRTSEGYRGIVLSVGERAIHLRLLNDDTPWRVNSVHHIDDPELKYRKGLRQYGAWDFSPEDKEVNEKLDALEKLVESKDRMNSERIAALTKRLESLEKELGVKK